MTTKNCNGNGKSNGNGNGKSNGNGSVSVSGVREMLMTAMRLPASVCGGG